MVKVGNVDIPKLDLSKLQDKTDGGPKISDQKEKAPKLGAGNSFLISVQALVKSLSSEKTYAAIRNELKKEVILDKKETMITKGELGDSEKARKLGLSTEKSKLSDFKAEVENNNGDKKQARIAINVIEKFFIPPKELQKNPESVKAFFSNMINQFQSEMKSKGMPPEDNLKNFKSLASFAFVRAGSVNNLSGVDKAIFKNVGEAFGNEYRTEKQEYMKIMDAILTDLSDVTSDIGKTLKELGQEQLTGQYSLLLSHGGGFVRDKGVDASFLYLLNHGGTQVQSSTQDFKNMLDGNKKFQDLKQEISPSTTDKESENVKKKKSDKDNKGEVKKGDDPFKTKPTLKDGTISKDSITALGSLTIELLNHVKANGINDQFKAAIGEYKDQLMRDALLGKITVDQAVEGLRILGDSSVILRLINPVITADHPPNPTFVEFGKYVQLITINSPPPPKLLGEQRDEYNTQLTLIAPALREFVSAMGLPTLSDFKVQIENLKNGVQGEVPSNDQGTQDVGTEVEKMKDLDKKISDNRIDVDLETAMLQELSNKGLLPKDDEGWIDFSNIIGEITPEQQRYIDEQNKIADQRLKELEQQVNDLLNSDPKTN